MTIVIAEGASFSFVLVAANRREAEYCLKVGWKIHQQQTGAGSIEDACTVNYIDCAEMGILYRDYQSIHE